MARPTLTPWTLGKINTRPHPTMAGHWQARGYYNDANNKRNDVTASGKTEAAAKRSLQTKVNEARTQHVGGDALLNNRTRVGKAAEAWLDSKRRERTKDGKGLASSTLSQYEANVRRYITESTIEHLTLTQVNDIARVEAWLTDIADNHGEGAARAARKVLSGVLELAERRGAIPASMMHRVKTPGAQKGSTGDRKCADEDCDYDCGKRHLDTRRAFTRSEASAVLKAARQSNADIADLTLFLFTTGVRIREALECVSWADVDLDAQTVRVRGTKTKAADRTLALSDDLTKALRERADLYGTTGLVFGTTRFESKMGQPRQVTNVRRAIKTVLDKSGCQWAGTHTFRRTVATWMDERGESLGEIAAQLGHANVNVTGAYIARKTLPQRAATIMVLPAEPPNLSLVVGR